MPTANGHLINSTPKSGRIIKNRRALRSTVHANVIDDIPLALQTQPQTSRTSNPVTDSASTSYNHDHETVHDHNQQWVQQQHAHNSLIQDLTQQLSQQRLVHDRALQELQELRSRYDAVIRAADVLDSELQVLSCFKTAGVEGRHRFLEKARPLHERDRDVIAVGNRAVHDGVALPDAVLFTEWAPGRRREDEGTFIGLYGFEPRWIVKYRVVGEVLELADWRGTWCAQRGQYKGIKEMEALWERFEEGFEGIKGLIDGVETITATNHEHADCTEQYRILFQQAHVKQTLATLQGIVQQYTEASAQLRRGNGFGFGNTSTARTTVTHTNANRNPRGLTSSIYNSLASGSGSISPTSTLSAHQFPGSAYSNIVSHVDELNSLYNVYPQGRDLMEGIMMTNEPEHEAHLPAPSQTRTTTSMPMDVPMPAPDISQATTTPAASNGKENRSGGRVSTSKTTESLLRARGGLKTSRWA